MVVADAPYVETDQLVESSRPYQRLKMLVDWFLAVLLAIPCLPLTLLLALLVKLTSRGPVIFRQVRVGLHGKHYTMYKLRTMRVDAEAKTGPVWAMENDPRVTLIGRFLRKSHLDELPQLWNVLRGDMGLVGPRPERPEFVVQLARDLPNYLDRLNVRPGVTGLAQIYLPPDTDLESVRRKLAMDLRYLQQAGLLLDLRILTGTALRCIGVPAAIACRFVGLDRFAGMRYGQDGDQLLYSN